MLCHTKNGDIMLGEEKKNEMRGDLSFLKLSCGQNKFWTRADKWEIGGNYQEAILGKFLS